MFPLDALFETRDAGRISRLRMGSARKEPQQMQW